RLLARGSIGHEQNFLGLKKFAQPLQFFDEGLIDFLTPGGVENIDAVAAVADILTSAASGYSGGGGAQHIFLVRCWSKDRDIDLPTKGGQLLDRSRTSQIHRDQTRRMPLFLQQTRQLRR